MFVIVDEFQRAVHFRLGRYNPKANMGPGIVWFMPCFDTVVLVDMRTISFEVPRQEGFVTNYYGDSGYIESGGTRRSCVMVFDYALTKDSVTVGVDAVVYYRIKEPMKAITSVVDYNASTRLLAATTLRNVLGTRDLANVLSDRETLSNAMRTILDEATGPWGIEVERVEIKDVSLPQALQKAMAAEAEAGRQARAKILVAEGEIKASKALKEASIIMMENPTALQLRYLQTLAKISEQNNKTVIFPLPTDILKTIMTGK